MKPFAFTSKWLHWAHEHLWPIADATRRTATATEGIHEARGRTSGLVIEGSVGGEPVPVTLADAPGDNSVSSEQLPAELGPAGGLPVEGTPDGIPMPIIGAVDQGAPGGRAWPVDGSAVTQPVSIAAPVKVTGTVTTAGGATVCSDGALKVASAISEQLPAELGPNGALSVEGAPDGIPIPVRIDSWPTAPATWASGRLAFGSITSSFVSVLVLVGPARVLTFFNSTDTEVVVGFANGAELIYMPAYSVQDVPLNASGVSESRGIYVKHNGTAPLSGAFVVNSVT